MLLSVCIPVYRYNALPLARELVRQADEIRPEFGNAEILLYDDASPADGEWARAELHRLPGLTYVELPTNLGRAAIRNRLVRDAAGGHCLLLDADAAVPGDFLANYARALRELAGPGDVPTVLIGGRRYAPAPPDDPALHLHWWYGTQRESDATAPDDGNWFAFHSNNFLAPRALLLRHPFPDDFTGYGHEDTLWGQQFTGTDVRLRRVFNSVVHLGLEPAGVFLRKQEQAIANLHRLQKHTPHLRTRLIDLARQYPRLTALARYLPEGLLVRYLTTRKRPDLRALDLLKLRWWARR